MISRFDRARPLAILAMRTAALIAVTLALILVVLPAFVAAAGPQGPIGG